MKKWLANKILKAREQKRSRRVAVHTVHNSKRAIIMVGALKNNSPEASLKLIKWFKQHQIDCDWLVYLPGKKIPPAWTPLPEKATPIDKKDLNWLNLPKSNRLQELLSTPYDMCISMDPDLSFCQEALLRLSQAQFKIGHGPTNASLDFIIQYPPSSTGEDWIRDLQHYLVSIKVNQ